MLALMPLAHVSIQFAQESGLSWGQEWNSTAMGRLLRRKHIAHADLFPEAPTCSMFLQKINCAEQKCFKRGRKRCH